VADVLADLESDASAWPFERQKASAAGLPQAVPHSRQIVEHHDLAIASGRDQLPLLEGGLNANALQINLSFFRPPAPGPSRHTHQRDDVHREPLA